MFVTNWIQLLNWQSLTFTIVVLYLSLHLTLLTLLILAVCRTYRSENRQLSQIAETSPQATLDRLSTTFFGKRRTSNCSWFSLIFLQSLNKSIRKIENNSHSLQTRNYAPSTLMQYAFSKRSVFIENASKAPCPHYIVFVAFFPSVHTKTLEKDKKNATTTVIHACERRCGWRQRFRKPPFSPSTLKR